ncbi:hypothetical protein INR49_013387 [Caranx melampygus]|nr:hypothetical protein INR49_013387 [Caranx melampygus]
MMDFPPRPELFDFHGVPMIHYFTDNWENVQNFQARPDDILLSTYPKAGNTWVSYILDLLRFDQTSPECEKSLPVYVKVPLLEGAFPFLKPGSSTIDKGTDLVDNQLTSPRLIKTHLPIQLIVYVARNAKDSVVSFFHFQLMSKLAPEPGDWNSYLQRFMEGKMGYGSWYDHVNSWWEKKKTYSNLHYMFFEDLVEDTGREIDKLCYFLGLSPAAEEKERLLDRVHFDNMKKDKLVNYSIYEGMDLKVCSFIRKGKVGDWKNHFTVAQSEEFDEDYKKKMKNPTLKFRTEI